MECDDHHCAVEATSAYIAIVFVFHFCLYFHLYFVFAFIFVFVFVWSWSMEYDDHHRAVEATSANRLEIHSHWIYLISKSPQPYHMTVEMEIGYTKFIQCKDMMSPAVITSAWPFFYWGMWYILLVVPYPHLYRGSGQANLMWPKHGRQSVKELWASDKTPTS